MGTIATAAGHYALGRGHLALANDLRAEQELQAAWDGGYRDPRTAYALALAQGRLYRRELHDLERLPKAQRARPEAELARRYRDPALRLLRVSGNAGAPAEHIAALIAFNEQRYDDALRSLDAIDLTAGGMASIYEVPALRGQILHWRAIAHAERGEAALRALESLGALGVKAQRGVRGEAGVGERDHPRLAARIAVHGCSRCALTCGRRGCYLRGSVSPSPVVRQGVSAGVSGTHPWHLP